MAQWTAVLPIDDLPEAKPTVVTLDDAKVLLYRAGEQLAVANECTHQGAPLDRGVVKGGSDPTVTCPAHGSVFRLSDGRVMRPPAGTRLPAFEVRVAEGSVELRPVPPEAP